MPLPWEEYQPQSQQQLPWQDFQPQNAAQQAASDMSAITSGLDKMPEGNPIRDAQAARNVAAYEAAPWYKQAPVALSDELQQLAHGASFGLADKAAAYLRSATSGKSYGDERAQIDQQLQAARDRSGWAGTAAELAGGVKTAGQLAGQGLTLTGRLGTSAMEGLPGVLARAGLMAPEGAAYGAVNAYGNDQNIGTGAGIGAVAGSLGSVAGDALSAGLDKFAGLFNKKPAIPSQNEITTLKDAAYKRAEDAGVVFTPQGVDRIKSRLSSELADIGFDPALQPGVMPALKRINDISGNGENVTLKGLDTIRKIARNGYDNSPINPNKSNNAAVTKVISAIDDLISNPGSNDVLMGDAQAGQVAIRDARDFATREAKLNSANYQLSKAKNTNSGAGGNILGGNIDNRIRQRFERMLENPKGLTADERQALETVVYGRGIGQSALRAAGKLAPTGIVSLGMGSGLGAGLASTLGLPMGASVALPVIGAGSKLAADAMTKGNVGGLLDVIAAGGQKSATQAAPNMVQRLSQSEREPLGRLLMMLGINGGNALVNAPRQ